MTVCNMTIEGGGRAGMIAPDDTTFEWVDRPAGAAEVPDEWRELYTDEGATFDKEVVVDAGALSPQVTWGTTPAWSSPVTEAGPEPQSEGDERASSTWASRPARRSRRSGSTASSSARARTRGSATCAPPPRCSTAARCTGRRRDGRPRLAAGEGAGRGRGPRRGLPRRRLRLALGGLLDVPRDEPGHPAAGRALRLHLEPQLRGPPGPRRAHPPGLARRWPPRPPSRATSSTSGSGADGAGRRDRGRRPVLDRADVDTDQIIPKQFLKRVERTGFGEFLFYDWAKEDGWDLPANPILATGRNFGCGSSREHAPWALEDYGFRAVVAPRSPTSSIRTARRSGCCRWCCPRTRCAR